MKRLSLILGLLAILSTSAIAGPFGLEMGMSLKEIGGTPEEAGHGVYILSSVPKPHSSFKTYIVRVAPKGGLYWIKAVGDEIATSVFGVELNSAFSEMEQKLVGVYGKHAKLDFLRSGSIWDEPEDWMMGLLKKERVLAAIWKPENESSLPADLIYVGLYATALKTDSGYIAVEYSLKNQQTCEAELAAEEDDAL